MEGGLLIEVRRENGALAGGQDNHREQSRLAGISDVLGQQELSGCTVVNLDEGEWTGRGDDGESVGVECNHDGWMSPAPVRGPRSGPVTSRPGCRFRGAIRRGPGQGFVRWPASGHNQGSSRSCGGIGLSAGTQPQRGAVSLMVRVMASIEGGPNGQGVPGMGWEGDATASRIKCRPVGFRTAYRNPGASVRHLGP